MKKVKEYIEVDIRTLGYYLDRALCAMIKDLNKELRAENLNLQYSHFSIMKILSDCDGRTQTELSELIGKEKSGVGRALSFLEQEGYITRCAINGCTNKVFLTEKGKNIMPLINNIANRVTERAFQGFSEENRDSLMKNLTTIYKNYRGLK